MNERTEQLIRVAIRSRLDRGDDCDECDEPLGNEPRRRVVSFALPRLDEPPEYIYNIVHRNENICGGGEFNE